MASGVVIIPMKTGGTRPPFLLFGITLGLSACRGLVQYMPADQPVYALDYEPNPADTPGSPTVSDIIDESVSAIRAWQPRGPYYLGGYSAGGTWAVEIARRLTSEGDTVPLLAMVDTFIPGTMQLPPVWTRVVHHTRNILRLKGPLRTRYIRARLAGVRALLAPMVATLVDKVLGRYRQPVPDRAEVIRAAIRESLVERYTRTPYTGVITYFRATDQIHPTNREPQAAWQAMATGGWRQYDIPGDHTTIMSRQNGSAARIASILDECLIAAQARAAGSVRG
jgi:thioesterase domain-containing protein